MRDQIRTFSDEDRLLYGGDYGITRTIPKFHPLLHIPLPGTRSSIEGAESQIRTFYRGDIINKLDTAAEYNFTLWKKDGSDFSREYYLFLTIRKGFRTCIADEWEMSPELMSYDSNPSPYEVEDGLIVLRGGVATLGHGAMPMYEILMWRTAERMLLEEAKLQVAPRKAGEVAGGTGGVPQPDIASVLTNSGVAAMPTQIDVIPHRYAE